MFLYASALILFATGMAKVFAVFEGHTRQLHQPEPLFGVTFATLFVCAAVLEVCVAVVSFIRPVSDGLLAVAWLSTVFLTYRVGLWWIGWKKPCSCLGNLTDALHISPQLADNIMKGLLAFMFIGSVSLLATHLRAIKNAVRQGKASALVNQP